MHLLLIRHGQTSLHSRGIMVGWTNDPGLDAQGRVQVQELAQRVSAFSQMRFDALYTSPLPRAQQTAEILGGVLGLPLCVDENLKDINVGDWTGQPYQKFRESEFGRRYFLDPVGVRFPHGEEIEEVQDRVIPVVMQIRRDFSQGAAILVSHHDVIKLIVAYCTGQSLHGLHRMANIPTASGVMISFLQDNMTQVIALSDIR